VSSQRKNKNRRVLVIDDNRAIHEDFRKILRPPQSHCRLEEASAALLGETAAKTTAGEYFEVDSAYQGQQGLAMVQQAVEQRRPYAMAFVDVRMPPGWDGLETAAQIWHVDPRMVVVFCTAYSDYSWQEIIDAGAEIGRFLLLKKPFENIEVLQLATFLSDRLWTRERLEESEARLRRHQGHLEELVQARTAELMAANAARGEFLANVSHEFRTPMTAILGFTDELIDTASSTEARKAAETVKRNGEHLLQLVNDILDLSKIEVGKFKVRRVACSPRGTIDDVVELMRGRAEGKGLSLRAEYHGPIPVTIDTDPVRLRQILINLVGNAVKFTETGSVRIGVRLVDTETTVPKLQCDVVDTGIGLAVENIANLFDPFTQADDATSQKFHGTGLGLAISRRLADMLGGTTTAERNPGGGSTFTVTVETGSLDGVAMQNAEAATAATSTSRAATSSVQPIQLDCRILLVEDGLDNQRLIDHMLSKAGAEVTIAENGQVAVQRALESAPPFDLILMDIQMPVMDGYEATESLRRQGYSGPIIALTAHAMGHDERKCRDAGCDGYLTKPINQKRLLEAVIENVPSCCATAK